VYNRRRSVLDFTVTGAASLLFTCVNVEEWFVNKLYITIGVILEVCAVGCDVGLLPSQSDSLSESTEN